MMKKAMTAGMALMVGFSSVAKNDGRYLSDLTMNFKTTHLKWAPKLKGGKIKAFFIVARKGGRDVIEAAQRMSIEINATTTVNAREFAVENMYESAVDGTTKYEKKRELLGKLNKKYDLFVIGNFNFDKLPAEAKFKILSQVKNGAGLVFVYPRKSALKKLFSTPVDAAPAILALVGKKGLPERIRELKDSDLVKTYTFGKGRIALLDYKANHHAIWNGLALSVLNKYSDKWEAQFENNMVLLLRTMKWAATGASPVKISSPALKNSPDLKQQKQTVKIQLKTNSAFKGALKLRLRNEFNAILENKSVPCEFEGELDSTFTIPLLSGGLYYLDVRLIENGETVDFGYFAFTVASPIKTTITVPSESIKNNGTINTVLKLNKPVNGSVEVTLTDSPYGRIWFKQSYPLNSDNLNVKITDYHMPTLAGYLRCAVKVNGTTIATSEKTLFFPETKLENYLEMAWDCAPGETLGRIYSTQVVDTLGWRAGLTHPSKDGENARIAALLNQRFIPYMTRIGLKKGKKGEVEQYSWFFLPKSDRNAQKALNGDESFSRPEVKRLWAAGIKHRIKNLPKYGPAIYTLGDENNFSYFAGFGKSDLKAFRLFLKQRYESIVKLNKEWGSDYASFDVVPHLTLQEAKEKKNYAAWYDHRQYMEKMYADINHFLSDEIKKIDPDAKVGAEGSVPGNLEETIKGMEFWGPYSDPVMDEVLRCLGGDKVRTLWWGGYVGSHGGRGQYPIPLWKGLLTGAVNGNSWYSGSVAGGESILGSDMDFASYAKPLISEMVNLKNGIAQLLNVTPMENDGIAILWSHASESAALLDQKFVNPKNSTAVFIQFCYRNALNFDFITESKMDELPKYKVLFLFGASSISEKESAAILKFTENGGTVIADLNPGILNGHLRPVEKNSLAPLFGDLTYGTISEPHLSPLDLKVDFKNDKLSLKADKANMGTGEKAFIVKTLGKGESVLLNFDLASAETTSLKEATMNSFLLNLLKNLSIKPSVQVSGIEPKSSIIRLRKGNGFSLVGILIDKKDVGEEVVITTPATAYAYIPGKGLISQGTKIRTKMGKPFKLIALFDKKQSPPPLELSSESASPGIPLFVDLTKFKPNTVLLLRQCDSNGKYPTLSERVIITEGKIKKHPVYFPYTAKKGEWNLTLTEIATGLKTTKKVTLKGK